MAGTTDGAHAAAFDGDPAPVTVRVAEVEDLQAAGAVVHSAYLADGYTDEGYGAILANAADRARDAEVAVALDGAGRVVGSVTFVLPGSRWAEVCQAGEAEVRMLGVAPSWRRRGVGEALVRYCVDRARQERARRLLLLTLGEMDAAKRLYARLGFARRRDLDQSPFPALRLIGYSLELR